MDHAKLRLQNLVNAISDEKLERFAYCERKLQAFSFKDLQTTVTLAYWMYKIGMTFEELMEYVDSYFALSTLRNVGYFNTTPTPEHLKAIKEFEAKLSKDLRRRLRKLRLEGSSYGRLDKCHCLKKSKPEGVQEVLF